MQITAARQAGSAMTLGYKGRLSHDSAGRATATRTRTTRTTVLRREGDDDDDDDEGSGGRGLRQSGRFPLQFPPPPGPLRHKRPFLSVLNQAKVGRHDIRSAECPGVPPPPPSRLEASSDRGDIQKEEWRPKRLVVSPLWKDWRDGKPEVYPGGGGRRLLRRSLSAWAGRLFCYVVQINYQPFLRRPVVLATSVVLFSPGWSVSGSSLSLLGPTCVDTGGFGPLLVAFPNSFWLY